MLLSGILMILKESKLVPADRCGVWLVKIIHVYSKFLYWGKIGHFCKISVRKTLPYNRIRKKRKCKSLYIRSIKGFLKRDGSNFSCYSNSVLLLKKRLTPLGSRVLGPINFSIKRKRARNSFIKIL